MTGSTFLDRIADATRRDLAVRRSSVPRERLEREAAKRRPLDFVTPLRAPGLHVIAEIKRASPSRGAFPWRLTIEELARAYIRGGASAISVLTERSFFKGSLSDLTLVRETVRQPLLRKDFVLDPYQVIEARAYGADAVLLIAALLGPTDLRDLFHAAVETGLTPLVEVHDERDLEKAMAIPAGLVGINNRSLADFTVDLETSLRLRRLIPAGVTVVSESGIHSAADVERLRKAAVNAVLIGEALVISADPAALIRELLAGTPPQKTVGVAHASANGRQHGKG